MDDARLLLTALPDASARARLRPVPRPLAEAAPPQAADRQPDTVADLARVIRPGGELRLATDDAGLCPLDAGARCWPSARFVWTGRARRAIGASRPPTGRRPATRPRRAAAGRRPVFLRVLRDAWLRRSAAAGRVAARARSGETACARPDKPPYSAPHPLSAARREWASARSLRVVVSAGTTSFNEVAELIEPTLRDMGFELVQVRMIGGSRRTLQVMAEPVDRDARHDRRGLRRDQPCDLGRARRGRSDPGRLLARGQLARASIGRWSGRDDFERFAGFEAKVECEPAGRGAASGFAASLRGLEDDEVVIEEARAAGPDPVRVGQEGQADAVAGAAGRARPPSRG